MFPLATVRKALLTHVFFIIGFGEQPGAGTIDLGSDHLNLISPLIGTFSGQSVLQRSLIFLKVLSRAKCYLLTVGGSPEDTANLIENIVEHGSYVST